MKVSIHVNSQHLSQMVSQISRTYDFDCKFMEKRCGLSLSARPHRIAALASCPELTPLPEWGHSSEHSRCSPVLSQDAFHFLQNSMTLLQAVNLRRRFSGQTTSVHHLQGPGSPFHCLHHLTSHPEWSTLDHNRQSSSQTWNWCYTVRDP